MTKRNRTSSVALGLAVAALAVAGLYRDGLSGCSVEPEERIVQAPPPPGASCGEGVSPGQTRKDPCEGGEVVMVCSADGTWQEAANTCKTAQDECSAQDTSFAAVEPILSRACASCHPATYAGYDQAKERADDYLARFESDVNAPGHMPKGSSLTDPEVDTFRDWIADGLCPVPADDGGDNRVHYSHDDSVGQMLADVTNEDKIPVEDRPNIRYLLYVDRINAGASQEELDRYKSAAHKALKSVTRERETPAPEEVAPGILRVNIDDYGISREEWLLIEEADLLNLESKTQKGELLKLVTGTRKPWMYVSSFTDAALRNANVYHTLLEIPATFPELMDREGVNYDTDILERNDVIQAAFTGSPLSPHNRMVSIHDSDNGKCFVTYDTGPIDEQQENFTFFPLLGPSDGQRKARFIAGEVICTLPNGLHFYALYNAQQTFVQQGGQQVFVRSDLAQRQDVAPINVVFDYLRQDSKEIQNGVSCFRCHAPGILPYRDQIRSSVVANGAVYQGDRDLILDSYKEQRIIDAAIAEENTRYQKVLNDEVGINGASLTAVKEPITVGQDKLLNPWSLSDLCSKLWLRDGDCRVALNQSAVGQQAFGQLLTNGTIPFETVVQEIQALIDDLGLLKDPV